MDLALNQEKAILIRKIIIQVLQTSNYLYNIATSLVSLLKETSLILLTLITCQVQENQSQSDPKPKFSRRKEELFLQFLERENKIKK